MIAILAVIAVAAFGIMVVIGASVLESENAKRHPPDDDGCREDEGEP